MITILKIYAAVMLFQWMVLLFWMITNKPYYKVQTNRIHQHWKEGFNLVFFVTFFTGVAITVFAIKFMIVGKIIDLIK